MIRGGHSWRSNAGQVLVIFALALPVILGMAALVVDFGDFFVQKRSLQKAADAAALAAAVKLPCTDTDTSPSTACQDAVAQLAGTYAGANFSDFGEGRCPNVRSPAPCYES